MKREVVSINEFSEPGVVGYLLQEASTVPMAPRLLSDNGRVARFEAYLQDTKQNRNGRLYKGQTLSESIMSGPVQERLRTRTMYGEAGHPFTPEVSRQCQIDMTRVSHIVVGLSPPDGGGVVRGVIETAATGCGRDMHGLITENNSTVAFSMRGVGKLARAPGGLVEVTSPLALVAYDWVTFPSHSGAYMSSASQGLMEGCAPMLMADAAEYAADRSENVMAVMESFGMESPDMQLTEDQASLVLASGRDIVKVFLEADLRAEFRSAFSRL